MRFVYFVPRRGATLVNSWSGCAAWFFQSCPYFKPKHVILRTRFQTWPLKSIAVSRPYRQTLCHDYLD